MEASADSVAFETVVELLERMERLRRNAQRVDLLRRFFHEVWRDDDVYPLVRLLLPGLDRARAAYGIKEKQLARLYAKVLGLGQADADVLAHYRRSASSTVDLPDMIQQLAERRLVAARARTLSVAELNRLLDALLEERSNDARAALFTRNASRLSPRAHKWLARIVLRRSAGAPGGERVVFDALHPDAAALYKVTSDVVEVCRKLFVRSRIPTSALLKSAATPAAPTTTSTTATSASTNSFGSSSAVVQFGMAAKPMLAARCDLAAACRMVAVAPGSVVAETKYDGERVQVHVARQHPNGLTLRVWARSGGEETMRYGPGLLDAFQRALLCEAAVFDGELLLYDADMDGFAPFGSLRSVGASLHGSAVRGARRWLCVVVFDLLWINGESILRRPLADRRMRLVEALRPAPHHVEVAPQTPVRSADGIARLLDEAIERGDEGLMLKDTRTPYVVGGRSDEWRKLKPDYVSALADPMDLLIVGATYGRGRRGGDVGSFLVGVFDAAGARPGLADGPGPGMRVIPVARVGSGFSDEELAAIRDRLRPHWRQFDASRVPPFMAWAPGEEAPDLVIAPPDSLVLSVVAGQFVASTMYHSRLTLRFPRVVAVRYDKTWTDCASLHDFQLVARDAQGRFAKSGAQTLLSVEDGAGATSMHRRRGAKRARTVASVGQPEPLAAAVLPSHRAADVADVGVASDLFRGMTFCVLDTIAITKREIERLLHQHGAARVQNVSDAVTLVVADRMSLRVQNVVAAGLWDVVRSAWVLDAVAHGAKPPLYHNYLLFATERTRESVRRYVDDYGDVYAELGDRGRLVACLERAAMRRPPGRAAADVVRAAYGDDTAATCDVVAAVEQHEMASQRPWWGLFRFLVLYLDVYATPGDSSSRLSGARLNALRHAVRFYGGRVADVLDESTTHVVVDPDDCSRVPALAARCNALHHQTGLLRHVVTWNWLFESMKLRDEVNELDFRVRTPRNKLRSSST